MWPNWNNGRGIRRLKTREPKLLIHFCQSYRSVHPDHHLATHTIALSQATQLLQARKSEDDVIGICDMCDKLRVSQIIKILNLYTPAGWLNFYCYEVWQLFPQTSLRRGLVQPLSERSRVGFRCDTLLTIVQQWFHLFLYNYFTLFLIMISPFSFSQERAMEEAKNQVTLLMDTKFSFAVRFPFNPSNINFAELEVSLVFPPLSMIIQPS